MAVSFSGGEVRGGPLRGTEVWNRDPLPPPPPPPIYSYRLLCQHPDEAVPVEATATSFEGLISFEHQLRALGYEFLKLERLPLEDSQ